MTNTRTTDVEATVNQIKALERVGADIVRVSVPTARRRRSVPKASNSRLTSAGCRYSLRHRIALKVAEYGVDRLRISPGNIGNEERIRMVLVDCARDKNIPIRIGVNARIAGKRSAGEKYGVEPTPQAPLNQPCAMSIISIVSTLISSEVSVEASDVFLAVESYRLAKQIVSRCI